MPTYINLTPGDPAAWFKQRSFAHPRYAFDAAASRYVVLCFYGSARDAHSQAAIDAVRARPHFFDETTGCFFGVSHDPSDETQRRVADHYPGYRHFWDFDGTIGRLYGSLPLEGDVPSEAVRRMWIVLDPTLRVLKVIPFATDRTDIALLLNYLDSLPPAPQFVGFEVQAPILILPNVFEPDFCQTLIDLYEKTGGRESGFVREVDGKTVEVHNPDFKRRKDVEIDDRDLIRETQARFKRRVLPMIQRAHQFQATRMERYIVSCYSAEDEGHFRAHRDNTTKGTAHRRFAVSVNLNADFDGGDVVFPEYGPRGFKAPPGGAVVFSCSLMHAVSKVTRGRRFAFLPFLYDDAAARLREANNKYVEDRLASYKRRPE